MLAVEAGRSVMLDRELLISKAEEAGVAVIGLVREEKPNTGPSQRRSFGTEDLFIDFRNSANQSDQESPKLSPRGIWPNFVPV